MVSLAEPRRRQKWTLNPRGNLWANDENKFGHKLMEKMGWEKGKGLGANQDGTTTHITVKQKDNQKGVGFEGHDDTWLAHQDDFQAVLAALNIEHGAAGEGLSEGEKKASLEVISRKSKRRVHYQKFVKGKDSSNYSADDLGCILGTKSDKVGAKAKAVEEEAKGPVEEGEDTGKFQQAKGSYQDYFAAKMAAMKAKGKYADVPAWSEEAGAPRTVGLGAAGDRQVDREVERDSLLCPDYLRDAMGKGTKGEKVKQSEIMKDEKVASEDDSEDDASEPVIKKSKKQKKEEKRKAAEEEAVEVELSEEVEVVKKKKKSKKQKSEPVEAEEIPAPEPQSDSSEEKTKKKKTKKSKKERVTEEEKEELITEIQDSGCEEMEVKSKKSKKSKKDKNKNKHAEEKEAEAAPVEAEEAVPEQVSRKRALEEEEDAADAVEGPKKKKKKSKKSKPEV